MATQIICDMCNKPIQQHVVVRTSTGIQIQFYPTWYPNVNEPLHLCYECIMKILKTEKIIQVSV